MFLEYWMIFILAIWWILSIYHITNHNNKKLFETGIQIGIEGTLRSLEKNGIISIDHESGVIRGHSEGLADSNTLV